MPANATPDGVSNPLDLLHLALILLLVPVSLFLYRLLLFVIIRLAIRIVIIVNAVSAHDVHENQGTTNTITALGGRVWPKK